jgi:phenylpropionate dioxygenase-like ring-hydroxylating dioxygenase large terminal subunit
MMDKNARIAAIEADIVETAALPLEQARTFPAAAYIDPEYYSLEREKVLKADWLCLEHVSRLKKSGDFVALDVFDEPLMIVRDAERIRVLSRVCAHRSIDILPVESNEPRAGNKRVFVCPYHAWSYNLDGTLRGCPHMQGAAGFDKKDWRLGEFRSEIWNGFIFVNFDGKAPPLAEQYAAFDRVIAPWHVADMELVIELDWSCNFNWKVMVENFMESYHHIAAHAQTLNPFMPGETTWAEPEHPHFIHAHLPYTPKLRAELQASLAGGPKMPGFPVVKGLTEAQREQWNLFLGYPCFMFLTTHDRVIWYRLLPTGVDSCQLLTTTLVPKGALSDPGFADAIVSETQMLRTFHVEDMVVNAAVQRGLKSQKVVRGRLSHLEEPIWLLQRYDAARLQDRYPAHDSRAPFYGPQGTKVAA